MFEKLMGKPHGRTGVAGLALLAALCACKPGGGAALREAVSPDAQAKNGRVFFYKRFNGGKNMLCMAECSPNAPEIVNSVQVRAYCKHNRRGMLTADFHKKA